MSFTVGVQGVGSSGRVYVTFPNGGFRVADLKNQYAQMQNIDLRINNLIALAAGGQLPDDLTGEAGELNRIPAIHILVKPKQHPSMQGILCELLNVEPPASAASTVLSSEPVSSAPDAPTSAGNSGSGFCRIS